MEQCETLKDRGYLTDPQGEPPVKCSHMNSLSYTTWNRRLVGWDQPTYNSQNNEQQEIIALPSSQGYGFSVVMYGCESWTVKKAERRRIDAFEL